jgi:hypothetical protein
MPYSPRYRSIEAIGKKTANRCHICHEEAHPDDYGCPNGPLKGRTTTVDHIVPQSHGGDDHPDNLLLAHADCNASRGTRPVAEARLQHAGTTRKPLSSGQELAKEIGIAALVVGALAAVGAGLWWIFGGRKKTKQSQQVVAKPAQPTETPPQSGEAIVLQPRMVPRQVEQAILDSLQQLSSTVIPSPSGLEAVVPTGLANEQPIEEHVPGDDAGTSELNQAEQVLATQGSGAAM